MAFSIQSAAFSDGGNIPARHTCDGDDLSPQLSWTAAPAGTMSFSLIMDDPDAPAGTFTHWVLFDIPASAHELAEGQRPAATGHAGRNDFSKSGYGGPCPPRGHGPHRYYFSLYALDLPSLGLSSGASRHDVERAMKGHTLGEARLMGKYERRR